MIIFLIATVIILASIAIGLSGGPKINNTTHRIRPIDDTSKEPDYAAYDIIHRDGHSYIRTEN